MSRFKTSMPSSYFDEKYDADPDPWRFATSPYEREKYTATLSALPRAHYRSALEVGCSIGILTRMLAPRCDALLSVDGAQGALAQASLGCSDLRHVEFKNLFVPNAWPNRQFDLVLLSEVVYYLDRADIERLGGRIRSTALPKCDVVLVHWIGETNYPLTGDEAAETLIAALRSSTSLLRQDRADEYRLDVLKVVS